MFVAHQEIAFLSLLLVFLESLPDRQLKSLKYPWLLLNNMGIS